VSGKFSLLAQSLTDSLAVNCRTITSHLSSSTRSATSTYFLAQQYNHCRASHEKCGNLKEKHTVAYPSRLLEVGTNERSLITLRDTRLFRGEEYACLSHCWGHAKPFKLTTETHTALLTGVDAQLLPRTFRDAIYIAQRLRIRFLWIDSLYASDASHKRVCSYLFPQMYPSRQRSRLGN
jgi:hypothetical protein